MSSSEWFLPSSGWQSLCWTQLCGQPEPWRNREIFLCWFPWFESSRTIRAKTCRQWFIDPHPCQEEIVAPTNTNRLRTAEYRWGRAIDTECELRQQGNAWVLFAATMAFFDQQINRQGAQTVIGRQNLCVFRHCLVGTVLFGIYFFWSLGPALFSTPTPRHHSASSSGRWTSLMWPWFTRTAGTPGTGVKKANNDSWMLITITLYSSASWVGKWEHKKVKWNIIYT